LAVASRSPLRRVSQGSGPCCCSRNAAGTTHHGRLPNVIENLQSSSEMALLGQKRGRYLKFFGQLLKRLTPKSGHLQCTRPCPLWANSGNIRCLDKLSKTLMRCIPGRARGKLLAALLRCSNDSPQRQTKREGRRERPPALRGYGHTARRLR